MTFIETPRTLTAKTAIAVLTGMTLMLALQNIAKAEEVQITANPSVPAQTEPAESYSPPENPC